MGVMVPDMVPDSEDGGGWGRMGHQTSPDRGETPRIQGKISFCILICMIVIRMIVIRMIAIGMAIDTGAWCIQPQSW